MPDADVDLQRVLLLRGFPGFDVLGLADVSLLANNMVERSLPAGTVVSRVGQRQEHVHFVVRGRIVRRNPSGAEIAFGPKMVFGGLTALAGDVSKADAIAAVDTWTLSIATSDIIELLDDNFSLVRSLSRTLGTLVVRALEHAPLPLLAGNFASTPLVVPPHELGLAERILILRTQRIGIGPKRIQATAAIAREAEEVRLPRGTVVWRTGDPADVSLIVLEGRLRLERPDGLAWHAEPVQIIGGLEALGKADRWYTCTCETEVRALSIERRRIIDVLEDHIHVAFDMVQGLARTLERLLDGVPSALQRVPSSFAPTTAGSL